MPRITPKSLITLVALLFCFIGNHRVTSAPALPNPVLYLTNIEPYRQDKKNLIRYRYDVFNKDQYPAEMFAAAPQLPPCGTNRKASRTWVDIYDQRGKKLQSFCALSRPGDLNQIWFAVEQGTVPPSWIYVELTDRQTNTKYKSNLAETSL
jgi:hypothetical protein